MLQAAEALQAILARCRPLPPEPSAPAPGLVLAEPILSDLDMPPFDKSLMDGYAVRAADGPGDRDVAGEILAGQMPTFTLRPDTCVRIMTGAPIPDGADAVIPHELTTIQGEGVVTVPAIRPGANIHRRASEYPRGKELIAAGTPLRPQEIGVLAAVGRVTVSVIPPPRVAILATGDELVEPPDGPGPGQIRNSNGPLLAALVRQAGSAPHLLGIGRDSVESLTPLIAEGLGSAHVLVLAGGVSAGKLDLVPGVLASLGVTAHIHKVNMKPGKPLLFGTTRGGAGGGLAEGPPPSIPEGRLVFGLPGNPVSAFVCFELFVRPSLDTLAGRPRVGLPRKTLPLAEALTHRSDRPTYHPAAIEGDTVRAVPWKASADLVSLLAANALIVLPAGDVTLPAGAAVETLALDV